MPPPEFANLWLGHAMGKVLFLTHGWGNGEDELRKHVSNLLDRQRK
jgi:hypothetical protein